MANRGKTKRSVSLAPVRGLTPIGPLPGDGPTLERLAKLPGVEILQKPSGRRVAVLAPGAKSPVDTEGRVRASQSPLDRLAVLGRLDTDRDRNAKLYDAGDRLRLHWYLGGLGAGPGSIDLNRTGGGSGHPAWLTPSTESAAYHRDRFRRARDGMEAGHWQVLFGICCGEDTAEDAGRQAGFGSRDAAAAVALDRLRRGLELLAIAWGILPPRPANDDQVRNPAGRATTQILEGDAFDAIIERLAIYNTAPRHRKAS
jgi:hypothetical protein